MTFLPSVQTRPDPLPFRLPYNEVRFFGIIRMGKNRKGVKSR